MSLLRRGAGVVTAALAASLLGLVPTAVSAPAVPVADPGATTVSAPCLGGEGEVVFTVYPRADDGSYRIDVTGKRMVDGSHWRGRVLLARSSEKFQRTAVDGGWSVSLQTRPIRQRLPLAGVDVREGKGLHHRCFLIDSPAPTPLGAADCSPRRFALLTLRHLDDGSVVVGVYVLDNRPGERWRVDLRARSAGASQSVAFTDYTRKDGLLRSRVELGPVEDPRLRVVARRSDGRQCRIGLNPGEIPSEAAGPRQLLEVVRALRP